MVVEHATQTVVGVPAVSFEPEARSAVAELALSQAAGLYRVALGICRDRDEAQDLVQDTLLRLLTQPAFARARRPLAYARTAMVRLYLGRKPEAVLLADSEMLVDVASGRDGVAEVDSRYAALAMLRELPPRARSVLALRYLEDMSDREIAATLDIARSTVRVTAHHALNRLAGRQLRAPHTEEVGS